VTISYRWDAPDYDREQIRPLTKPIGGFFVGCSVEGLLALGTVRAHIGARAPKEAVIEGARYSLKVFRSDNTLHVRTFYPVFLGDATPNNGNGGTGGTTSGTVRMIAALINPAGDDPGHETVTLINTGGTPVSLDGWRMEDRNNKVQALSGITVGAGETMRVLLDPAGAQLSNKGGQISLIDAGGQAVQTVTYTKDQVRQQGETVLFVS
jgi:poly(U)-specific endoribonuclease